MPTHLAITDPEGCSPQQAVALRAELQAKGITLVEAGESDALELRFTGNGLSLHQTGKGERCAIMVDFVSDSFLYRLDRGGGRKQPLARAMGLKPGHSPSILDATAGLGRDGFLLAALGCQVTLCERSPIIHALLRDGLARAAADPRLADTVSRITLHGGDSRQLLLVHRPQVVSLDPMFPHRSKSALVKKEMRVVRAVVGEDPDSGDLLEAALQQAERRVVCKRPIQAPTLPGRQPDFAITTPKHRFDIYLQHRSS